MFRWAGSLREDYVRVEWAATPLGPMLGWPQSLRTALSICLASAIPSVIAWGPDLTLLYNEAFVPILGDKLRSDPSSQLGAGRRKRPGQAEVAWAAMIGQVHRSAAAGSRI